jgi:uncharacterized membrane protein SpoIIM required for sporulation
MNPSSFFESRKSDWDELNSLITRSRKGENRLSPEDIRQLSRLYRAASSDLALAQREFPNHQITAYLNQMVARAHSVIYRGEPFAWNRIGRFVTSGFPRVFRQTLPFTAIAALFFIIPALLAGAGIFWRLDMAQWLLPAEMQSMMDMAENQELWTDIPWEERPFASAFIMRNNIQVAFLAFGSGVTAGLVTIWVMVFNGLILGGITGLTAYYGIGFDLWTFVIGHGVIELSVIFMAGGAGLMLGWAIINPGLLRRRDALALAARKAIRLVIGCIPLLVIAGTIEGFISPSEVFPWQFKWTVGIVSGIILYGYLFLAGREKKV